MFNLIDVFIKFIFFHSSSYLIFINLMSCSTFLSSSSANISNSCLKLDFIEFPKLGLKELKKITKKITELNGCVLLVDYGYRKSNNENT